MKSFMILLAFGLAASDKLDRTYLPPPGSKFAGGSPGAIQVPLEFPKETYSTTARPQITGQEDRGLIPGDTQLTVGIDRGTGLPSFPTGPQDIDVTTPGSQTSSLVFQKPYKIPTTTTSYAFTQTTTFPPIEGFETTTSPLGPSIPGLQNDGYFIQQQGPGQINYPQPPNKSQQIGQTRPGYPPGPITGQQGLLPTPGSIVQRPGVGIQSPALGGQIMTEGLTGYPQQQSQNVNRYQQGLQPTSTISPISGSLIQAGYLPQLPDQKPGSNQYLGVQPPAEAIGQQNIFPAAFPTQGLTQTYQPGTSQYVDSLGNSQFIPGNSISQNDQRPLQPVGPQSFPSNTSTQYFPSNYQGFSNIQGTVTPGSDIAQQLGGQSPILRPGQQRILPSADSSQGISSTFQPNTFQYDQDLSKIQGSIRPGSNIAEQLGSQSPLLRPGPGQQGTLSSTVSPQGIPSTYQPDTSQYGQDLSNIQSTVRPGSNIVQQLGGQSSLLRPGPGQQGTLSSTVSPPGIPSTYQPDTSQYGEDLSKIQGTIRPGSQTAEQLGGQSSLLGPGQQRILSSTVSSQGVPSIYQPNISEYGQDLSNIQGTARPGSNIAEQLGGQSSLLRPGQQGILPSTPFSQGTPSNYQLGTSQYSPGAGNIQGTNIPQTGFAAGQPTHKPQMDGRTPQQFPPTSRPGPSGVPSVDTQNIYRPDSTATSSVLPPGYSNQPSFPSTTPTTFPSFSTTASSNIYSPTTAPFSGPSNIPPSRLAPRPERPQAESDRNAVILNYENILSPEGFAYSFDTSNGIHADESGTATDGVKALGSYSYTGDDGKFYEVIYSADENGFLPRGDHLPTPPPVPEAIQRVIEQAAREKEAGILHDGSYDEDKYGHKKYQGPKAHSRPQTQDKTVDKDIPEDYESKYNESGNKKLGSQSKSPIISTDGITDEYDEYVKEYGQQQGDEEDIYKNGQSTDRLPFRRPINKVSEQKSKNVYDEEGNVMLINVNNQPVGQIRKDSSRRRPMAPNRKPNKPGSRNDLYVGVQNGKYEENLEETDGFDNEPGLMFDDSNGRPLPPKRLPSQPSGTDINVYEDGAKYLPTNQKFKTGKPKGNVRPGVPSQTLNKDNQLSYQGESPGFTTGTQYVSSEDYTDEIEQTPGAKEQIIRGRPKGSKRPGSSTTSASEIQIGRPRRPGSQIPEDGGFAKDRKVSSSDVEIGPKAMRQPAYYQQTDKKSSMYLTKKPGTGYQYIPPQNKLDHDKNRFPSRFPEKGQVSFTEKPFDQHETSNKQTTVLPFMTPNVSRDNDETYETNVSQTSSSRKPGKSSANQDEYESDFKTDIGSEYVDEDKDQGTEDEIITASKGRPGGKPDASKIGVTRRPIPSQSQQTTTRPQYGEQFNPAERDGIFPKIPSRPGKEGDHRYPVSSNESSKRIPGQDYSVPTIGSSKRPSSSFVSSTTSIPSRASDRFQTQPEGYYRQTTQTQYPTSFGPMGGSRVDEYSESIPGSRRPGIRQKIQPSRPNYLEEPNGAGSSTSGPDPTLSLDRSTSRPSTDYYDGTTITEPTTIRSGFPRVDDKQSKIPGYVNSRPGDSISSPQVPSTTAVYYDRTVPSSTTSRPGLRLPSKPGIAIQNLPSTTYRPNYTFTDKNQSGQSVDGFGRPVSSEQESSYIGSTTTYRPEYSVTSTQQPGLPGTYQEGLKPGQSPDIYRQPQGPFRPSKLNNVQPGSAVTQGSYSQGLPDFGPVQRPQTGLYKGQTSTERVIGEDFSGPKQQQKFDPNTGYYY